MGRKQGNLWVVDDKTHKYLHIGAIPKIKIHLKFLKFTKKIPMPESPC